MGKATEGRSVYYDALGKATSFTDTLDIVDLSPTPTLKEHWLVHNQVNRSPHGSHHLDFRHITAKWVLPLCVRKLLHIKVCQPICQASSGAHLREKVMPVAAIVEEIPTLSSIEWSVDGNVERIEALSDYTERDS